MASHTLRRRAAYRALGRHKRSRSHPFLRVVIVLLVGFTMFTSGASAGTIFFYGENMPTLKSFKSRFQFQNTVFRASDGRVLYNMADLSKKRGRRVVEPLIWPGHPTDYYKQRHEDWLVGDGGHGIPVLLQNATIATEDASFYSNLGFDPLAILRSGYYNLTKGHIVSGASTITQQLVRNYMLDPSQQTFSRKTVEIILAAEMTQKYPKSQILWYYMNSVPYGNLSIGAQAAAETYFKKPVWQLDLAESALLAGLPEAPTVYNPMNNLPAARGRMRHVLQLMYDHGYLLDSHGHRDRSLIASAMLESLKWKFSLPQTFKLYPHFVQYAIDQLQDLSQKVPALHGRVYNGLDVWTTLDERLQDQGQQIVRARVADAAGLNITDGALVSMDLRSSCYGCVLSMVGSADYNSTAIHGQINMADTPRQPGSSFKPFNYVYGFEHGLAPGTTVLDAPVALPDQGNPDDGGWYEPTDYDHMWHGVVTLRVALANSLNVPAVKVEQANGVTNVANQAVKQGITSLFQDNPHCCGWALTLGGLDRGVRLVQETAAYGAFATGGMTVPPIAVRKVFDRSTGKLLYDSQNPKDNPFNAHRAIDSPAYAYLMTNVLSDNNSRCTPSVCEFGLTSPLYLGRPAAAKTGTTNSFTDNWTVGYTPDIVTGVWVGNADNSPMAEGTTGVTGAAPIWHDYMLAAFKRLNLPPKDFIQPPDVYAGSECRQGGPYYNYSSTVYDIFAGIVPLCSVGTSDTTLPIPPPPAAYQPPAQQPAAPQMQQQPAAPQAAAPTVAPAVPTVASAAPTAAAPAPPVQSQQAAPPAAQQQSSTGQGPATQPPSQQAPAPPSGNPPPAVNPAP